MGETSIKAMLEFIIPRLIRMLMEKQSLTEKEALTQLYSSELYRQLEREETKLWHLSVPTLYDLWVEEKETGHITYPEDCIEEYKNAKGMNGKSVIDLFNRYRVIDYIRDYYEALHTTGRQYIVDDISMYIEARQPSMA